MTSDATKKSYGPFKGNKIAQHQMQIHPKRYATESRPSLTHVYAALLFNC